MQRSEHAPAPALSAAFDSPTPSADVIVQLLNAALGVLATAAFASKPSLAAAYLAFHAALGGAVYTLARVQRAQTRRSRALTFVCDWLPLVIFASYYFELSAIIPALHPFSDHRYDRVLEATDFWLLGDPNAVLTRLSARWLSDLLTLCYAAYFPMIVIVPAVVYARGDREAFRRASCITLVAFAFTYTGYMMCPAVGPHLFSAEARPAVLDGYGIARRGYELVRQVRAEPPDAFPSGHALMAVLAPALAWSFCRALFAWLLPVALGIVLATIYLRYHYVADVIAALLLAPLAWKLGSWLDSRLSRT